MAGNGALDLSIRIMGKVDPSLVTAIKQTKGLTGDLASDGNKVAGQHGSKHSGRNRKDWAWNHGDADNCVRCHD